MNAVDPRTVIMLAGVMSGLMSLVLYGLKRNFPSSIKGLGEWSVALLIIFAGGVLVSARGVLPDFVTISVSTLFLWFGLWLAYRGSQRFFGHASQVKPWLALILGILLVQIWFAVVEPNYPVRLILTTVMTAALTAVHANLIIKQGAFTYAKAMAIGVLAFLAATQVMRLVTSVIYPIPAGAEFLDKSIFQLIYITSFAVGILLFSISTVLMATDRLRLELEHLATHDSLTNALTRRQMNDVCDQELERCRRHGRSMAVMMMDLDHFKAINDTYGHQAGDRVLISFVSKVNTLLRSGDHLGRFGGEEFMAVLPDTSMEDAVAVAQRILEICPLADHEPSCTVSIGITTNHKDSDTLETLLARADATLYRAKANGRNRVEST